MNRGDKDYIKLSIAREKIRIHEKNKTGKDVLVCSDEALDNLYKRKPRYKKELAYIPGLGTEFMEKYGDAFMKVLDDSYYTVTKSRKKVDGVRNMYYMINKKRCRRKKL